MFSDNGFEDQRGCPIASGQSCGCRNPGVLQNGCSKRVDQRDGCATFEFWCKPGYELEGDDTMQCQRGRRGWRYDNRRPRCACKFKYQYWQIYEIFRKETHILYANLRQYKAMFAI